MEESYRLPKGLLDEGRQASMLQSMRKASPPSVVPNRVTSGTRLSKSQLDAIRAAMQLFVQDDIAQGLSADKRLYCEACERTRPAAGFIQYDRYLFCNSCATEYEIARARGLAANPGHYVRDKHFGETAMYTADAAADD